MSIACLVDYCHTATSQLETEVEKILGALKGVDVAPSVREPQVGLFNNSVDLLKN